MRHRKLPLAPSLLGVRGRFPSVLKNTRHLGQVFLTYLIIILAILLPAAAAQNFTLTEGDLLKLRLRAADDDGDPLSYMFTPPLDDRGEWQTAAGDAGEYPVTITVSDGKSEVTQDILIMVRPAPQAAPPPLPEPDIPQEEPNAPPVLEPMTDIIVDEGEEVRVQARATDPDGGRITITYSGIVDEDGRWQTKEGDAGEYEVTVIASDGKDTGLQRVRIVVSKKEVIFPPVSLQRTEEGKEIAVSLPGEGVQFALGAEIPGVTLQGNVLRYLPDTAAVQKGLFAKMLQHLGIPYTPAITIRIPVIASREGREQEQAVAIRVQDVNRPPVLDIGDVQGQEGQWVALSPAASDPDGDFIRLRYSGWMQQARKQAGYGDAGDHPVTVSASDGREETSKDIMVRINSTNRPPQFQQLKFLRANEGDELAIPLFAADPDDEEVRFSIVQGSPGARIEGNMLLWRPAFTTASRADRPGLLTGMKYLDFRPAREVQFTVAAADSAGGSVSRSFAARVYNKNQAPGITGVHPAGDITVARGARIIFSVNATDGDDDGLVYTWVFGAFDRQRGGNAIARTFMKKGVKAIVVEVSDGDEVAVQTWRIRVV